MADLIRRQASNKEYVEPEIKIKETFDFRINREIYRFAFINKGGNDGVEYYKLDNLINRIFLPFDKILNFDHETKVMKDGWRGMMSIRLVDRNKNTLDVEGKDEKEFKEFVNKLGLYVKKIN